MKESNLEHLLPIRALHGNQRQVIGEAGYLGGLPGVGH